MNHLHINIEWLPRSGKIHPLLKVFEILKPDFKSAWCYQQSLISAFRGGSRLVGSVQRARETLYCGTDAGWMSCEWKRRMLKKEQLASSGVAVPLKREGDAARWQWFVFILVRIAPAFQESLYCLPLGLQMNHTHTVTHTLTQACTQATEWLLSKWQVLFCEWEVWTLHCCMGGELIINTFCERYQKHFDSGT